MSGTICGSPALVHDTRALLAAREFAEGNRGEPGQFVVEKAFVESDIWARACRLAS